MATIRLESVVTSQTAGQTLGYYKVYVSGNPSSTKERGIIPIILLRQISQGEDDPSLNYTLGYLNPYVNTYKNESELYLYPDQTGYYTSPVASYDLERFGVAWEEGILDDVMRSIRNQFYGYISAGYMAGAYAEDYFTNFYVFSATPLSTPIGLNATNITSNSALVSWAQNANASNFKIEYKINGDTSWTQTTSD